MSYYFALIETHNEKAGAEEIFELAEAMKRLQRLVNKFGTLTYHGTNEQSFKRFQAKIKELGG